MKKYLSLGLWVVAFEAVSFAIGASTQSGVEGWYGTLNRPGFAPPNIAFPVVWTILYALIAAAGWHIWRSGDRKLLALFAVYMILNWTWSFIFFTAHLLLPAFLWIVVLDVAALALIVLAWRRVRPASLLMIAPTAWTLFAAVLSGAYWWLNR